MDHVPLLCIGCRFGAVIPACVAQEHRSVFWCRQGVPRVADRTSCPCFMPGPDPGEVTEAFHKVGRGATGRR